MDDRSINIENPAYRWMVRPISTDVAMLLLRVALGATMAFQHGAAKVFGGMPEFIQGVEKMGFPAPEFFAWAAALSEFLGGILIMVGLGTRIASFLMACSMAVAVFITHAADPFQVKELAVAYLVSSVVLFLMGPGKISLDHLLARRKDTVTITRPRINTTGLAPHGR